MGRVGGRRREGRGEMGSGGGSRTPREEAQRRGRGVVGGGASRSIYKAFFL